MLAQDVRRIGITRDVMHTHDPGGMRRTCFVEGQAVVSLLEASMGSTCRVDHGLIIAKDHRAPLDWYTKVAEG